MSDDDDFQDASLRKTAGLLAAAAAKKREKKASSSSSRAPKPTSVHVQVIGGGSSGSVGSAGGNGTPLMHPPPPQAAGPAGKQASPPMAPPPHSPLAPLGANSSAPLSATPTPTKKATAKRKAPATPAGLADGEERPAKAKAARTPKAATPRASTSKPATPGSGGGRVQEADIADLVEAHLLARNKPLNGQMISDGLLGDGHKVSRAAVEKQLALLVERGGVSVGEWNKARLWWPTQERLSATDDGATDAKIEALQARLPALKAAGLATAREVSERKKQPAFEQLAEQLQAEEAACAALRARIATRDAKSKEEASKKFTPAEAKKVRAQYEKLQKEWTRRKRMLREKLQEFSEDANKKVSALAEEMGIELDEVLGVDPTQFGVRCKFP